MQTSAMADSDYLQGNMETGVQVRVKEETMSSVSPFTVSEHWVVPPVTVSEEGVVPPVTVSEEGVVPPVSVSEEGVVNLWRAIGSAKGFSRDTDLAKFLMSLYMNYDDPGPKGGGSSDVTAGGLQTDNQTHRPTSRDGKTQTDAQCSKCSHPLALVCINRQCQRSPGKGSLSQAPSRTAQASRLPSENVPPSWLHSEPKSSRQTRHCRAPLKKSQLSASSSSKAEPRDAGPDFSPSSGDEMDVEELSPFEAESSAEESDTALSEGCPAQAKLPSTNLKHKASQKHRAQAAAYQVDSSLQPIILLEPLRPDFQKYACQTSAQKMAKADHFVSGSLRTEDKTRKLRSNISAESGAGPKRKFKEVCRGADSRKRVLTATTDTSGEDSRENTDQAYPAYRSPKSINGCPDTKRRCAPLPAKSNGCPDTKRRCAPLPAKSNGCQDTKRRRAPLPAMSDGCSDTETRCASLPQDDAAETTNSPRVTPARHSIRGSGPLKAVQPAEQPVTTATGKYPVVDGVAYRNGRIPVAIGKLTRVMELKCSQCHKTFPDIYHINRHVKNPSCDDGKDDQFKVQRSTREVPKEYQRKRVKDEEWEPKSGRAVKDVEKKMIPRRFRGFWSKQGVSLQEFMTGRVMVPIYSCETGQFDQGSKQKQDKGKWHCSHYTCFKCYTVFEMKRKLFVKHEEKCDGTRDGERIAADSERQGVEGEHAMAFQDADMATADSQKVEGLTNTSTDDQLTTDVAKTTIDCQLTNNLAKITPDDQPTEDLAKTITGQLAEDLAKTTTDGQLTEDIAKTTSDDEPPKDLAKTTTDGQLTEDIAKTTSDDEPPKDLAKTTTDDQLIEELAKTTLDCQPTPDRADQSQMDQPSPQPDEKHCQLDTKSIEILRRVKERYLFSCPTCDLVFFSKEHQKTHALSHFYVQEASGAYSCHLCKKTLKKLPCIRQHFMAPTKKHSQCGKCGLSFSFNCQKYPHMRMHRKEAKALAKRGRPRKEKVPSLCPMCGNTFRGQSLLQKHILSHSDEKPYACSVCGKALKSELSLKTHEASHDGPQFQCEVCGKKYFSKKSISEHVKIAHMGVQYRCEQCRRELSSKAKLSAHIKRVHTKSESYSCRVCEFTSSCRSAINAHMRLHTGEKRFQCSTCLTKFARVDYLHKHMRIHTGERPYKCDDCTQSFVCATSLTLHRSRHHSDKTFPCGVCDQVLLTPASRDFHKYKAHGGAYLYAHKHPGRKIFPCGQCDKILYTAASLDFHLKTHQYSDQKSSEHQDSDQNSSEHQDSNQKSSKYQDSDQ